MYRHKNPASGKYQLRNAYSAYKLRYFIASSCGDENSKLGTCPLLLRATSVFPAPRSSNHGRMQFYYYCISRCTVHVVFLPLFYSLLCTYVFLAASFVSKGIERRREEESHGKRDVCSPWHYAVVKQTSSKKE